MPKQSIWSDQGQLTKRGLKLMDEIADAMAPFINKNRDDLLGLELLFIREASFRTTLARLYKKNKKR